MSNNNNNKNNNNNNNRCGFYSINVLNRFMKFTKDDGRNTKIQLRKTDVTVSLYIIYILSILSLEIEYSITRDRVYYHWRFYQIFHDPNT